MAFARRGNLPCVQKVLEQKTDFTQPDASQKIVIEYALKSDNMELVNYLCHLVCNSHGDNNAFIGEMMRLLARFDKNELILELIQKYPNVFIPKENILLRCGLQENNFTFLNRTSPQRVNLKSSWIL